MQRTTELLSPRIVSYILSLLDGPSILNGMLVHSTWHEAIKLPAFQKYLAMKLNEIDPDNKVSDRKHKIQYKVKFLKRIDNPVNRDTMQGKQLIKETKKDLNILEQHAMIAEDIRSRILFSPQQAYSHANSVNRFFREREKPKNIAQRFMELQPGVLDVMRENGRYWSLSTLLVLCYPLILFGITIVSMSLIKGEALRESAESTFGCMKPEALDLLKHDYAPAVLAGMAIIAYFHGLYEAYNHHHDMLSRYHEALTNDVEEIHESRCALM